MGSSGRIRVERNRVKERRLMKWEDLVLMSGIDPFQVLDMAKEMKDRSLEYGRICL